MSASNQVEALRPAHMRSMPFKIDRVFDDPEAIIAFIRSRGPYKTLNAYHGGISGYGDESVMPWFRTHFEDDWLLNNEQWVEAAKKTFSAQIVRPFKCILNINAAMPEGTMHLDLPVFRRLAAPQAPVWFLMNMSYSRLFLPWLVPIASGLAWFHTGIGGSFDYWADGLDHPPRTEAGPVWNRGIMGDNEVMFHRVGAIGPAEEQARLANVLGVSDQLYSVGEDGWEIRDGERIKERFGPSELRISLLWKAQVFADEKHLASFEDKRMDLTIDQIVDIYLADLAEKGIKAERPIDPYANGSWQRTLEDVYSPYSTEPGKH